RRRDFYCGEWGTPECRQRYAELIFEWQATRRWPLAQPTTNRELTVIELVQRYWRGAKAYYSDGEATTIRTAWLVLIEQAGQLPAASIGPVKMRAVREAMIAKGWNRGHINKQMHRLGAIFKWAASNELLPVTVYQSI